MSNSRGRSGDFEKVEATTPSRHNTGYSYLMDLDNSRIPGSEKSRQPYDRKWELSESGRIVQSHPTLLQLGKSMSTCAFNSAQSSDGLKGSHSSYLNLESFLRRSYGSSTQKNDSTYSSRKGHILHTCLASLSASGTNFDVAHLGRDEHTLASDSASGQRNGAIRYFVNKDKTPPTGTREPNWQHRTFEAFYAKRYAIGHDSFGDQIWAVSRKGSNASEPLYAAKVLRLAGFDEHEFNDIVDTFRELKRLKELPPHPNVIELRDFFLETNPIYLVFDFYKGAGLQKALESRGRFSEDEAKLIMRSVLRGLAHMHLHGFAHRDLKLANILCDYDDEGNMRVKIADLGMSKCLSTSSKHTVCGTPMFMAPELLHEVYHPEETSQAKLCYTNGRNNWKLARYNEKADIWSAGVVMFMLVSGYAPFNNECCGGFFSLFKAIRNRDINYAHPVWELLSPHAHDMVSFLLNTDIAKRPTAEEALQHPWLLSLQEDSITAVQE